MAPRTMPITAARAQFLALADEVARTGQAIVISKNGTPLVRLTPFDSYGSLAGSVIFNVDEEELIYGTLDEWDVER